MKRSSGKLHMFEPAKKNCEKMLPQCAQRLKEMSWYPLCKRMHGYYVKVTDHFALKFNGSTILGASHFRFMRNSLKLQSVCLYMEKNCLRNNCRG